MRIGHGLLSAFHPRIHSLDLLVICLYLAGITWFGLRFRRPGRTLQSYFLADRNIPWWAIMLSIVSAETSTLTIISVPGLAYAGNFGFLQIVLGYLLGRVVVSFLFLPRYFRGELLTAYQLIGTRFGPRLHRVTAFLFLGTRAAAEGVRIFAVAIVIRLALGTGDVASIAIISILTLLYTFEGGLAAVIWTDVVQMGIYAAGIGLALWTLIYRIPGGWHQLYSVAATAGRFGMFNFSFNLTTTYTFWAGLIGGCFLTMASHGTDQLMVQRMLAARNLRDSQRALLASGVLIFAQFALFLLIGAGLFVYYAKFTSGIKFASADQVFPAFVVTKFPVGLAGLMIAAILAAAMSNLSAALNSLSSTSVIDVYLRFAPAASESRRTAVSRISTAVWAVILFGLAVLSRTGGHVVELGLSIASVAYGSLLGVFLLGVLTRLANESGAIIGMIVGFFFNIILWIQPHALHFTWWGYRVILPKVAWTWYVLFGAVLTFLVGYCASRFFPASKTEAQQLV
jgi:SSS family solute:Na+ symporter